MRDIAHGIDRSLAAYGPTVRRKIVNFVYWRGDHGATSDEVEKALNLQHQTVSARINEARKRGELIPTGIKRLTRWGRPAAVYVTPEYAPPKDQEEEAS